jgi:hypothetical protein
MPRSGFLHIALPNRAPAEPILLWNSTKARPKRSRGRARVRFRVGLRRFGRRCYPLGQRGSRYLFGRARTSRIPVPRFDTPITIPTIWPLSTSCSIVRGGHLRSRRSLSGRALPGRTIAHTHDAVTTNPWPPGPISPSRAHAFPPCRHRAGTRRRPSVSL